MSYKYKCDKCCDVVDKIPKKCAHCGNEFFHAIKKEVKQNE
jgi:hypothetical protein